MAPEKQQTSINEYLQKQEQQPNLIEQTSQKDKEQQSQESFAQSIQQRILNIQYDLKQQKQKVEKLENLLDEFVEQLNLQFPSINESLNKIQSQIVIKLEQIDKQFNEVPQLSQFQFQKFQYEIKQLQEFQEQQQIIILKFQDQQSSILMEIESEQQQQDTNKIYSYRRKIRCFICQKNHGWKRY